MIQSICPKSGELVAEYSVDSTESINSKLDQAELVQKSWKKLSVKERVFQMLKVKESLLDHADEAEKLMSLEMGKLHSEAFAEVRKCAWLIEYYCEHAESMLREHEVKTDASESFVTYQPIGTVLGIMPWNFPFWQVFRYAVPTLLAGNVTILKHASNVTGSAKLIETIFRKSGIQEDVLQTIVLPGSEMNSVISDVRVAAVSFTGSTSAGREIAKCCGENLKKCVLELGGSDPYVILEDADLEVAVSQTIISRMINAGQSCIGAKRVIIHESLYDDFVALLKEKVESYHLGEREGESTLAPLATPRFREDLLKQIEASKSEGATEILEGKALGYAGLSPFILGDVTPDMTVFREETFGPLFTLVKADSDEVAIQFANQSSFGLGGAVFTKNSDRGISLAVEEIEAGSVFVNAFVKSDPRLPFGGIKMSGVGRELSLEGIREFTNIKTIYCH